MKRIIKNKFVFSLIGLLLLLGCGIKPKSNLKSGDLLFVTAKSTGLSGAINDVTKKNDMQQYDHIGIVELEGFETYVLHAAPKGGSQRQLLTDFLKEQSNEGQTVIHYILNDNSYYCSDFIERAFRDFGVFKLEPMTFKDSKTGQTNAFWKEFYSKRNLEVPEGKLGCNPNGLAASEKLIKIGVVQ